MLKPFQNADKCRRARNHENFYTFACYRMALIKKIQIFFFVMVCAASYGQRIPEKTIDTFTIRTGKIVLYENNKWEYLEEIVNDTLKSSGDKNYFDSEMLINQGKSPYQKTQGNGNKKSKGNTGKFRDNADGSTVYIVKSGDTLLGIARKSGTNVKTLCRLNNISKTTKLSIGQKIKVR